MKKRILALLLAGVMALGLCACGGGADEGGEASAPAEGGNVVAIAMGSGFDTMDPGYCYEKYPALVINACYETLFKFYSNDGAAEPCLADTYEFSADNMTLTITLRDSTFASGNPVTSEDVKFSLERVKNLKGNPSFITDTIASIDTPDEKTVVLNLTQPDSAILSKLTYSAMAILDSKVVIENGGTCAEDASTADTAQSYLDTTSAGSGMYVMTSYKPDEEIVMEKNPNYSGEATNVDKYVIKIQPDANTQMMTLSGGDIDIAMNLTKDTFAEVEGKDGIVTEAVASKTVSFIMMNMDEQYGGPVSDPLVQQAIRKAVDYAGIQAICGEGTTTPYSLIQTGFMGAKGERSTDYTNVEEAKALLAEAGYADGFEIDLTVCDLAMEGILLSDLAQKVKDDLAQIGITVNIVPQPWAAGYGDAYRDGTIGFTVMYWGIDYNDPNVQLEFMPGASVGLRAGWTAEMDPDLAALYTQAMEAIDNDARTAILEQIQDGMYENGPFVMIAQAPVYLGYNERLTGVEISDPYVVDVTLINVAE